MPDLRYPIGKADLSLPGTPERRRSWTDDIAGAPNALRAAVRGLTDAQLATPYRPGGWTVRQVVHHVPDSHANAYIRFKQALTADDPLIMAYDEAKWAELSDVRDVPIEVSLTLLTAIHDRWVALLRAMPAEAFARGYRHPEHGRRYSLDEALNLYSWHSRHHVAHVTALRAREGWA
jgi:DinB family protein